MTTLAKKKSEEKADHKLAKKQSEEHKKTGYKGKDSREGRLHEVKTSHGKFRFKDNRKGE